MNEEDRRKPDPYAGFGRAVIKWIKENGIWGEELGDDLLDIAERFKLAARVAYDKKLHTGVNDWCEEGDEIWWVNG